MPLQYVATRAMTQSVLWCFSAVTLGLLFVIGASYGQTVEALATDQSRDNKKPIFAFITLSSPKVPTEAQLFEAVSKYLPAKLSPQALEINDQSVTLQIEECMVMAVVLDRPIPWSDLEKPCKSSLLWPEATKVMKAHKTHLLVALTGEGGAFIDRNILLTKFMAAATEAFTATGVYWGHGNVVVEPEFFRAHARKASRAKPPNLLWIGFFPKKNRDNTTSVLTVGMDYFDCMDIEVVRSRQSLKNILGVINGAIYLQLIGDKFEDGDTIGAEGNSKQRLRTYHRNSVINREDKVLRIEL